MNKQITGRRIGPGRLPRRPDHGWPSLALLGQHEGLPKKVGYLGQSPAHHRALHLGQLTLTGTPSTGLVFRHADGSEYGSVPSASRSDIAEKVFLALTGQGFSEKQARGALSKVLTNTEAKTCEQVLRASLFWLTKEAVSRPRRGASS